MSKYNCMRLGLLFGVIIGVILTLSIEHFWKVNDPVTKIRNAVTSPGSKPAEPPTPEPIYAYKYTSRADWVAATQAAESAHQAKRAEWVAATQAAEAAKAPEPDTLAPEIVNAKLKYEGQKIEGEVIIRYKDPDSRIMELVYDPVRSRIRLRLPITEQDPLGDTSLSQMKKEVVRFVGSKTPVELTGSGLSLKFVDGFPEWRPAKELGDDYKFMSLTFGQRVVLSPGLIEVHGQKSEQDGYNGYYPELGSKPK
jgi:hypothetical protein